VATAVYYDRPLYAQPALAPLGMRQGACPRAEAAAAEVVSIPLYPELSGIERAEVVAAVRDFATSSRRA
jgi:dTDP-4-amino-4,6-dideoxygalactose transaminase